MRRNIDRRVELVTPVDDKRIKRRLKEQVLDVMLRDNVKARHLTVNGKYVRHPPAEHETPFDSQKFFIKQRIPQSVRPLPPSRLQTFQK